MSWPDFLHAVFGIDPRLDAIQPGHSRGTRILLAVMTVCAVAYAFGIWKGL